MKQRKRSRSYLQLCDPANLRRNTPTNVMSGKWRKLGNVGNDDSERTLANQINDPAG